MDATVRTNLEHYVLWSEVTSHAVAAGGVSTVFSGVPPQKLAPDDQAGQTEWVVPQAISEQNTLTLNKIDAWFSAVGAIAGHRPSRITVALVNDDSTVVYYFVHDGIVKPKN